mgnify:CR=1 FL=1
MVLGYVGLLTIMNIKLRENISTRVRACGKMAFTNYITQTLLGVFVLGGLFGIGAFSRSQLVIYLIIVWALQIYWSKLILDRNYSLDEINELDSRISIFSHNKFNVFSFYDKDHGERDGSNLKEWVLLNIRKFNIEGKINKIKLLCYPRIFGYVFNPLSIFLHFSSSLLICLSVCKILAPFEYKSLPL